MELILCRTEIVAFTLNLVFWSYFQIISFEEENIFKGLTCTFFVKQTDVSMSQMLFPN